MKNVKDMYTEKISLWLDNQLNPVEVAELEKHLTTCTECRQTCKTMQRIDEMFRNAAQVMLTPGEGFTQRFETHLAHYNPVKPWQVWLAVSGLLLGTLFFAVWAITGGIALLGLTVSMLDVGLLYQVLVRFIESVANIQHFFNLGSLFLKAGFITMGEPLFWGMVIVTMAMVSLWVRVMQTLARRTAVSIEMLLF